MIQLTNKVNELIRHIVDLTEEEFMDLHSLTSKLKKGYDQEKLKKFEEMKDKPEHFPVCWNCDLLGIMIKELRERITFLEQTMDASEQFKLPARELKGRD